jgi:hypothetical protein
LRRIHPNSKKDHKNKLYTQHSDDVYIPMPEGNSLIKIFSSFPVLDLNGLLEFIHIVRRGKPNIIV